jgi:hypothetical protein
LRLSDNRNPGIPPKINLITEEKDILIARFKCYWETDFMWRTGRVETLNIMTEKIYISGANDLGTSKTIPAICLKQPPKHKKIDYRGYSFFLPGYFEENKEV